MGAWSSKFMTDIYDAIAEITEDSWFGTHDRSMRGHVTQLLFKAEVAARGFVPCTPEWNIPMDSIIVRYGEWNKILRVEVKQSMQESPKGSGRYVIELRGSQGIGGTTGSKKGSERLHDYGVSVDVIAAYIVKEKCWYIVPEKAVKGQMSFSVNPSNPKKNEYEKYRNGWDILNEMYVLGS